ncbi:MAG: MarR family transcriptional regulator [Kiritimatiellae bacterium]|nr:MarR family transcriptional regulator [Kiritimatiellia bacterium]
MKIEELKISGPGAAVPWVRKAAARWSGALIRAGRIYLSLYGASPLPRVETEMLFLLLLEEGEASEPSRLARTLHVSKQTMTGLVDRLEASGKVERADHPTDRRRRVVRLTPDGRSLAAGLLERVLGRDAALIATLDRDETFDDIARLERFLSRHEEWSDAHPL